MWGPLCYIFLIIEGFFHHVGAFMLPFFFVVSLFAPPPAKFSAGAHGLKAYYSVEDEFHVIIKCWGYLFNSISGVLDVLADLAPEGQFIKLSNSLHYKVISKLMYTILNQQRYLIIFVTIPNSVYHLCILHV